jgi:adenosylcobinamide kinase/adenosylcobinamide-phosphate guanylyltransferase
MDLRIFILDPKINPQSPLTLITGPARSGKTRLAVQWALTFPPPRTYLATAQNLDAEMDDRIRRHQEERGSAFRTLEESIGLGAGLKTIKETSSIIIVDCLTLWISNLLGAFGEGNPEVQGQIDRLLSVLSDLERPVILIGNEVGWGIVPDNPLARAFRDLTGRLHQEIARIAGQVILMVAGIPLIVKGDQ